MNKRIDAPSSPNFDDAERDTLSTRFELEAIADVLKTRFEDYSDSAPSLTVLSPTLDFETLREILKLASKAASFKEFCDELDALWASRDAQTKAVDEERQNELATAQLFNNFVVKILEERRRIGAAFLRRYVGAISPKVAQDLDFESYSTEPTVHIFGAQVARLCDLVFSIPFKDRSQGSLAVAVPMEHKSTQTRNVVIQLLTSLIQVLQFILRHKERYQRNDKKFVWPYLLLFYTGARPWKRVLNFPDLFTTPDPKYDKRWIFKLRFKFVKLFARSRRQMENDPWLLAFLQLTKAAEKIVAKKDATSEDWKKAWNDALRILEGKIDYSDEEAEIFGDFYVFVTKVAIRQGWKAPTREELTCHLETLGKNVMPYKLDNFYDLARMQIAEECEQKGVRNMLKKCLTLRFPRMPQVTMNKILSITDVNILESVFDVACVAESLDSFKRDVRGIVAIN